MKKNKNKIIVSIFLLILLLSLLFFIFYIKILPACVSNSKIINYVENIAEKYLKCEIEIEKPKLKTELSPKIAFQIDNFIISKNSKNILTIENFNTQFSLKDLLRNRIILNRFELGYIYVDINKLIDLLPKEEKEKKTKQKSFDIDFYDAILTLKKSLILYEIESGYNLSLKVNDFFIDNTKKNGRHLHFDINTLLSKNGKNVNFAINDKNKVLLKNKHIYIDDCILNINKSKIHINAKASKKDGINVNLMSKGFRLSDIVDIINSNILINNGNEMLSCFKDISGNFDFNIDLTKDNIKGIIDLNKGFLKIIPLNNLPVTVAKGKIFVSSKDITLKDFLGYYGAKKANSVSLNGEIKDYLKTCKTNLNISTKITNDFTKNYLSKMINAKMEMVGIAPGIIVVKAQDNKVDITMAAKVAKGDDILIEGASFSPKGYDRALKTEMSFQNNILSIKDINYYIASVLKKGVKARPVMVLKGNINCSNPIPQIMDFSFDVPNPLPSEFLNVFIGQKVFKGGKFSGNLGFVNDSIYPIIKGKMEANEIRIPKERLFIKDIKLTTNNSLININANGSYKRSKYHFKGNITNAIKYPIVVKNVDFKVDNIDIDRLLKSFNSQNTSNVVQNKSLTFDKMDIENENENEDVQVFDVNNLIIEKCILRLDKGKYKDINFGNLAADLTLNKDNILELKSNKFDIAEGISTLKVFCDLKNHKYNLRLGIKDVNSDIMSSSLLNLSREIAGKASGLIELNTDESLKLNGSIKFLVKNGQIQKIGLVEYVMKLAALFRNPLVMISPSTLSDLVNIPEGNFDKIEGELYIKNNSVDLLKIKSKAPQLASYIVGCYNIENSDTILRIYTKFSNKNKGFAGFMRNISLNNIANKIPISSRNDAHYYAAELKHIPEIEAEEKDCQIFLTKVDGDVEHNNFISSLKKIK